MQNKTLSGMLRVFELFKIDMNIYKDSAICSLCSGEQDRTADLRVMNPAL